MFGAVRDVYGTSARWFWGPIGIINYLDKASSMIYLRDLPGNTCQGSFTYHLQHHERVSLNNIILPLYPSISGMERREEARP